MARLLLVTEQLPSLVAEQVKAISNLKIDQVVVWDNGKGATARPHRQVISGLVGSLPPLHEIARNAGIRLPEYLGTMDAQAHPGAPPVAPPPAAPPAPPQAR